jgi:hypothetical protein
VLVAESKKEFVAKLEEALRVREDPAYRRQLARLAEENTWMERAGRVLAELHRRFGDSGARFHERT